MSKRAEFQTLDGTTLRGDLYSANKPNAPIIIMTQGLTLLKEHYLPTFGVRMQAAGYAVLIYDHRGYGSSEGQPRNQTDPLQQAEDYHDAVVFARSLPNIDPARVAIWGIGHSGGASMIAASSNPYIKAVVLVMPFISGKIDQTLYPPGLLQRAWEERTKKAKNPTAELEYIQAWDNSAQEADGERGDIIIHGDVPFGFYAGAKKLSDAAGTPWENRITLQSLYYCSRVEPKDFLYRIKCPVLHLAAEIDPLSGPIEAEEAAFANVTAPVREFFKLPEDHLSNYFSNFETNITAQLDFLGRHL